MNGIKPDIEQTDDGSATLRHPVFGDTYHSTRGAIGESQHVFITNGLSTINKPAVRIFEVGLGSGLNAWQSLCYGREKRITIDYTAVELYPVDVETVSGLRYTHDPLFTEIHSATWGKKCCLTDSFSITKLAADITAADESHKEKCKAADNEGIVKRDDEFNAEDCSWRNGVYDIIYFDAFAPDTQPEMWSAEIFKKLYDVLENGGILVTYSAKGSVKQALRDAGFLVRRLPGALGKRHMLRAEKQSEIRQ